MLSLKLNLFLVQVCLIIAFTSVSWANQYWAMRVNSLPRGNNGTLEQIYTKN